MIWYSCKESPATGNEVLVKMNTGEHKVCIAKFAIDEIRFYEPINREWIHRGRILRWAYILED